MRLEQRVVELHRALDRALIPHAFGGAIALAYATLNPRGTTDIDVNVFVPDGEPAEVLAALPEDIKQLPDTAHRIRRDGQIRLWWDVTPVDLFFDNLPVHHQAADHVELVPFEGEEIPILGAVELAVFKAMFSRPQDWVDIQNMLIAETLDLEAVRETLGSLIRNDDPRFTRLDDIVQDVKRGSD